MLDGKKDFLAGVTPVGLSLAGGGSGVAPRVAPVGPSLAGGGSGVVPQAVPWASPLAGAGAETRPQVATPPLLPETSTLKRLREDELPHAQNKRLASGLPDSSGEGGSASASGGKVYVAHNDCEEEDGRIIDVVGLAEPFTPFYAAFVPEDPVGNPSVDP